LMRPKICIRLVRDLNQPFYRTHKRRSMNMSADKFGRIFEMIDNTISTNRPLLAVVQAFRTYHTDYDRNEWLARSVASLSLSLHYPGT